MAVKWWLVGCVIVYFVMDACLLVVSFDLLFLYYAKTLGGKNIYKISKLPILGGT